MDNKHIKTKNEQNGLYLATTSTCDLINMETLLWQFSSDVAVMFLSTPTPMNIPFHVFFFSFTNMFLFLSYYSHHLLCLKKYLCNVLHFLIFFLTKEIVVTASNVYMESRTIKFKKRKLNI